jgi:hypothetical protein
VLGPASKAHLGHKLNRNDLVFKRWLSRWFALTHSYQRSYDGHAGRACRERTESPMRTPSWRSALRLSKEVLKLLTCGG